MGWGVFHQAPDRPTVVIGAPSCKGGNESPRHGMGDWMIFTASWSLTAKQNPGFWTNAAPSCGLDDIQPQPSASPFFLGPGCLGIGSRAAQLAC